MWSAKFGSAVRPPSVNALSMRRKSASDNSRAMIIMASSNAVLVFISGPAGAVGASDNCLR